MVAGQRQFPDAFFPSAHGMPFETGITGHLVRQHHLGGQRSRGEYAKSGLFGRVGHPQARVGIINRDASRTM
jgi:hypothetical protein